MNQEESGIEPNGDKPSSGPRFLSAEGYRWTIREVDAPSFDHGSRRHLIFDGETVMRRVRFFPVDWTALSDEALYALSWVIPPKHPS